MYLQNVFSLFEKKDGFMYKTGDR